MIDEDRTTWTLGQLADEVIEACELPMGCRGTIIAALGDAKKQGEASSEALREAATALYKAGYWTCDRSVDEIALWTALRDTARIPPGNSPKPIGME